MNLRLVAVPLVLLGCGGDSSPKDDADVPVDAEPSDVAPGDLDLGPGLCPASTAAAITTAELAAVGGRLVDEHGRDVQLRGLNTGGRSKWAPFVPFPVSEDMDEAGFEAAARAYYEPLVAWGLNTVRMPFSWEGLEPEEGVWDDDYLRRYEQMVDVAWSLNLRVIVDFHQDVFAAQFCGDGFPPWTVSDIFDGPSRHDCADWFTRYLGDPDVAAAFDRLFDPDGPIQPAFREMWSRMATRFADHPGVLGFEIINEPHWGTANSEVWRSETLPSFYESFAATIREAAPTKLIFYDSTGIDAVAPRSNHHRPAGDFMVYAPHLYDFGLLSGGAPMGTGPESQMEILAGIRNDFDVPVLIGEFGFANGAEGGLDWLSAVMDETDRHRLHTTLWEYSVSDQLWNEEDLSVVDSDGTEREILDAYVRPWLREVSGTEPTFEWHDAERFGTASWVADGGITELVVPAHVTPGAQVTMLTEAACWYHDMAAETIRVWAPDGERVELTFQMM